MKIENKEFWEREDVIYSQDKTVENTANYEAYLYEKAVAYFQAQQISIHQAKVFGCGTAREVKGLLGFMDIQKIYATDISENMIAKGRENIQRWGFSDKVTLGVQDAVTYTAPEATYELVTLMSCILTFVATQKERYTLFQMVHRILKPNGCLLGVVHNQVGTPQKTFYFWLRRLFKPLLRNEVGNRNTGFYGFNVKGYYFSKAGLYDHLKDNGFKNIEIKSLSELYKEMGIPYNRLKGYNNLIFFATK